MPELEDCPQSIQLVTSLKEMPWHPVDPRTVYALSGAAVNEIGEELQRLYAIRQALEHLSPPVSTPAD